MTTHKPATPLPWTHDDERTMRQQLAAAGGIALKVYSRQHDCNVAFVNLRVEPQDAAYIAHTANAYPKLVEALRDILARGEPPLHPRFIDTPGGQDTLRAFRDAQKILRTLGELA